MITNEYYVNTSGNTLTDTGSIYLDATEEDLSVWKELRGSITLTYPDKVQWDIKSNKKGDDDMRFLYEVILVNPKNDEFFVDKFVAKTETSALMQAYDEYFNLGKPLDKIEFDDLKTSCRVLMEWKKEKSLKKAIETIKEAVE